MAKRPAARLRLARLDAFDADGGSNWLGEDERGRLQAMASPERRRSFLAGHWLARELAAEWLQVGIERIDLRRFDDGRPWLHVDGAPSPLSLSLSHSAGWVVAALANVPVGVDVELPRRRRDLDALARFAFSPSEADYLRTLAEASRGSEFLRVWALKEARGKRTGEGMLPARSRRVSSQPSPADEAEATSWRLHDDGALALAIEPGAGIDIVGGGEELRAPAWWRYRDDG